MTFGEVRLVFMPRRSLRRGRRLFPQRRACWERENGAMSSTGAGAGTARVEGEILIRRPVEEVFDYVADERHEPNFNSRMSRGELLTPEPIGVGSRFGVEMTMMRRVFEMTVEFTAFERPRLLGSTSRSLPRGRQGAAVADRGESHLRPGSGGDADALVVAGRNTGARIKLLVPLVAWMGRRQERRVWTSRSGSWKRRSGRRLRVHAFRCVLKKETMRRRASCAEGSW